MGKLHACFVVALTALTALAACGDDGATKIADAAVDSAPDAKIFMDAPPPMFDLTCMGNAAPTTADATIALSGTAQEANVTGLLQFSVDPIDGATVKACDTVACNGGADGNDVTDAAGDWAIPAITTGGAPLNDYLELTGTGVRTTFVYPGVPFRADQAGIPVLAFGPGVIALVENQGCGAGEPIMAVAVTDCANMPITDTANINIVVKQGGNPVAGVEVTDLSTFPGAPAQVAGLFLVCNVPANTATNIGATYNGMAFLAHDVKTENSTTTTTLVRPGY